jgi:hypothetical protein
VIATMIQVHFTTYEFDPSTEQWTELPVAELFADGDDVTLDGPHADWISLDTAIVDPDSGQRITRSDGAERWARLLPFAYRSGDLSVDVSEVPAAAMPHAAQTAGDRLRYAAGS